MNRFIKLTAIAFLPTTLLTITIPNGNVLAARNPFDVCAKELKEIGVSPDKASEACANAVRPEDLSECVVKIDAATEVELDQILDACFRVRQPKDLGKCVVKINEDIAGDKNNLSVLDHCRRSLLPKRFSKCVIGLNNQLAIPLDNALETCIKAEDFPENLFPEINN